MGQGRKEDRGEARGGGHMPCTDTSGGPCQRELRYVSRKDGEGAGAWPACRARSSLMAKVSLQSAPEMLEEIPNSNRPAIKTEQSRAGMGGVPPPEAP